MLGFGLINLRQLSEKEEFETFVPGQIPRPPISMVFRLKGKPKDLSNVLPLMAGRGAVVTAQIKKRSPEEFYKRCETYFRTFITEPLHLAFPFSSRCLMDLP